MRSDRPLPQGEEKVRAVRAMFDRIAGRYDLVNRLMTGGLDVAWRRRTVAALGLPRGSLVLDLACGTGDLCRELQRQGYRAVGVDLSAGMLAAARTSAPLVQADILRLPVRDGAVDGATCGFALRNVASIPALAAEIARVVRPGGSIGLLETSEPASGWLRSAHRAWLEHVVPLLGGLLSDRDAYAYLPRSLAYLPPPAELLEIVRSAGFPGARRIELAGGVAQLLVGVRA
ncbi:MAG: demethylmenaquinone methyltransferase [Actinomycetota bacterium]|nr:MAG: demethylmenaquinone methyltransferase [Actinomycetota bacterium]